MKNNDADRTHGCSQTLVVISDLPVKIDGVVKTQNKRKLHIKKLRLKLYT